MKRLINYYHLLLPVIIIASSILLLRDYFFPQIQIILALLIAPFIFKIKEKKAFSSRYFFIAVFMITAYYLLHMKLFLFLGLGCFLFYSIESYFGKIGLLPFIFLICISPALHYVVTVFTFTLRLALSHYAADLLNVIGYPVECHGNYFTLSDGFTFNVDKACIGLNMFNTGLALTCLLIGLAEKKYKKYFSFFHLSNLFMMSCFLLIVTNFLRILMIVFFKSMPGTLSHELIGVFSMITYVALPMNFIVNFWIGRFGEKHIPMSLQILPYFGKKIVFSTLAFAFVFFSFKSVERDSKTLIRDLKLDALSFEGFSKEKKQDGVMEYRRDSLLVYIKPAVKVFESDHPPALCWKGSGFDVEQVTEIKIYDCDVLLATIKKGAVTQYTAWWYDNGQIKTTNQWVWRLSKGEPFRIVNLTSNNKEDLLHSCEEFLKRKMF